MAFESPVHHIGELVTSADLSASQFFAVKVDNTGKIALANSAGAGAIGILQNKPTLGQIAQVMALGITKAVAGGTITAGDKLTTDANGKLVTAAGSDRVIGIALMAAAAGDTFSVEALAIDQSFAAHSPFTIAVPVDLASLANAQAYAYTVDSPFRLKKITLVTGKPATTAAKAATLTAQVNGVSVTGGVIAATTVNQSVQGAALDCTAITAGNVGASGQTVGFVVSGVTAFVEGTGIVVMEFV